jgi:hypothetical protein
MVINVIMLATDHKGVEMVEDIVRGPLKMNAWP